MKINEINLSLLKKIDITNRKVQIAIAVLVVIVIGVIIFLFSGGSEDKSGFKETTTSTTEVTVPSNTPNIAQPCSLLTATEATTLLGSTTKDGVKADIDEDTMRCRYDSITPDGKYFLNVNVYVFKTKKAYNSTKTANNGVTIQTNVDDGYYAMREKKIEIERIVAIRSGDKRIALSISIASIMPNQTIDKNTTLIPDANKLAEFTGNTMAKLNKK
ncbi:MAG: hypothetical protein KBF89_01335 [Acidimicrobiia bacterium]|nr:hypothetical protein [Acidimicrobiia bacterium]